MKWELDTELTNETNITGLKNRTPIALLFLLLFVSITGCKKDSCLKSTGSIVKEKREIQPFKSLVLNNKINLFITQDTLHRLEVEAGENLLPFITTEITNGKLIIRDNNRCDFLRSYKSEINVYISMLQLDSINFSGSGIIKSVKKITTPYLIIDCWNATGSVNMDIATGYTVANLHSGAADITLSGVTVDAYLYSACSGWIFADKLASYYCLVNQGGTGDFSISVDNFIGVEIKSIGSVFFSGNPVVSQKITGTGKLLKR